MAKKIPLRKCIACQEMFSKKDLLRIVKTPENEVIIDQIGKQNGRGAYLCKQIVCLEKAEKSKALSRALGFEVPKNVYQELKEAFRKFEE